MEYSPQDLESGLAKMREAAFRYNDTIPAKTFNGAGIKPGSSERW